MHRGNIRNTAAAAALLCTWAFGAAGVFIRGDATGDGLVDAKDAAAIASYVFGSPEHAWHFTPPCLDAADVDDNGCIDVRDLRALLEFLMRGGPQPCAPFPKRGLDTTQDALHDSSRPDA